MGHLVYKGDRQGNIHGPVNSIIDCASYGNYNDQADVNEIYQVNVMRLLNLLKNSQDIGYKAFVITGSSSEYGKKDIPMFELMRPDAKTFYAASKVAATYLGQAWAKQMDKPIVIVRPFSATGPGEQSRHLIPTLIRSCLYKEPMQFVAYPTHDYVDIRDYIDGVMLVIENASKFKGEIFNIGTGIQYSNAEIKDIVERLTGKRANIEGYLKPHKEDKREWRASPFRLRSLGWQPQYKIEQTIRDMISYEQRIKTQNS